MTQVLDQVSPEAVAVTTDDLVAAIHHVLETSAEPLTLPKIRAKLPVRLRALNIEDVLTRQVAASVLHQFPRYRSQHDRYWDRPMPVHIGVLIRSTLEDGALSLSELRRKLPAYAQAQAETVLNEQLAQGLLYRHPRSGRGGERVGVRPPDPRDYLRGELAELFGRLAQLGFTEAQLREGAIELLHEQEWAPLAPPAPAAEPVSESLPAGIAPAEVSSTPLAHGSGPEAAACSVVSAEAPPAPAAESTCAADPVPSPGPTAGSTCAAAPSPDAAPLPQ